MENTIKKLTNKYRDDIKKIFNQLSVEENSELKNKYIDDFGSTISDIFQISDLKGYSEYLNILNEIDKLDPELSKRLEDYLIKEINLVALLGLHVALIKDDLK